MWLDTEYSSDISVKASDHFSGGLLTTSLYTSQNGHETGEEVTGVLCMSQMTSSSQRGAASLGVTEVSLLNTCWINATQKQGKGEKNVT